MNKIILSFFYLSICCLYLNCGNENISKDINNEKCLINSIVEKFPFEIRYPCRFLTGLSFISDGGGEFSSALNSGYADLGGLDQTAKYLGIYRMFIDSNDTSEIFEFSLIPIQDSSGVVESIINLHVYEAKSFYKSFIYFADSIFLTENNNHIGQYKYLRNDSGKFVYYFRKSIISSRYVFSMSLQISSSEIDKLTQRIRLRDSLINSIEVHSLN